MDKEMKIQQYVNGNQQGKVLLIVLAFSLIIQLIGSYIISQSIYSRRLVDYEQQQIFSAYITEAGLEWTLAMMEEEIRTGAKVDQTYAAIDIVSINEEIVAGEIAIEKIVAEKIITEQVVTEQIIKEGDMIHITILPFDSNHVKITVMTTWHPREAEYAVKNVLSAKVDKESLSIRKKEWFDF